MSYVKKCQTRRQICSLRQHKAVRSLKTLDAVFSVMKICNLQQLFKVPGQVGLNGLTRNFSCSDNNMLAKMKCRQVAYFVFIPAFL